MVKTYFQDHPHACGDKETKSVVPPVFVGSSPRVWGQVYQKYDGNQPVRIIPTRVGTSTIFQSVGLSTGGSSPRVWGQVTPQIKLTLTHRIIPTRVGTSVLVRWQYEATKDHPHACGDKSSSTALRGKSAGSSPRVWGQALFCISIKASARIIPTRVGTRSVFVFAHFWR